MLKTLLRVQISYLIHGLLQMGNRRGRGMKILLSVAMIYAVCAFALMFGMFYDQMLMPFKDADLLWLYFAVAFLPAFTLSFIFSVFMTQSMIYTAKDNERLLSMPIPPRVILFSRVMLVALSNFFTCAMLMLPAGVVYAMRLGVPFGGTLRFLTALITLPFPCTALSCLVGYLISLALSRVKRKALVTMVISFIFLALYFVFFGQINAYVEKLIAQSGQVAEALRKGMFPAYHFGLFVAQGGISGLYWLAIAAVPFALVYWILSVTFIRLTTANRGAPKTAFRRDAEVKVRTLDRALLVKEWKRFTSSAVYMLNAGLGAVFAVGIPIFLAVKPDFLAQLTTFLPDILSLGPAVLLAAVCFSCSMILLSAPSVSLEGRQYWVSRSLPIPSYSILRAKVHLHLLVSLVSGLVGSAVACFASRPDILGGLVMFLIPASLGACMAYLGVCVNLHFPRLDWTSEATVVKQGMSVVVTMLVGYLIVAAMIVSYIYLRRLGNPLHLSGLWAIPFLLATVAMDRYLREKGARLYERLG